MPWRPHSACHLAGEIASGLGVSLKRKNVAETVELSKILKVNLEMNIPFATGLRSEWAGTCKQ